MDAVYRLPYARTYHPMYEQAGGVPAISYPLSVEPSPTGRPTQEHPG